MPSADQTLYGSGKEFLCDTTQRTATLKTPGGRVTNTGGGIGCVNVDAGAVTTVQPVGDAGRFLNPGDSIVLPRCCMAFTFKSPAANSCNLAYESA